MADKTSISWTRSTHNHWVGCERVSPECNSCFAAELDARFGGRQWESGVRPRLTSRENRLKPGRWNAAAQAAGYRHLAFCGSMMDWADKRVPREWRDDLWGLVRGTPYVDWQFLTKRAGLIERFLPADWGAGYSNVWMGVSAGDRKHGVPRIKRLRQVPARVRFVSFEPLYEDIGEIDLSGIHWAIIGGESSRGGAPRVMESAWVGSIIQQCRRYGTAVWFKQWGGRDLAKGGCLVDGAEIKEMPILAAA